MSNPANSTLSGAVNNTLNVLLNNSRTMNASLEEKVIRPPAYAAAAAPVTATELQAKRAQVEDGKSQATKAAALPIGEGAYQSGEAVAQRTTDPKMKCEEENWKDCYKTHGDFVDHHAIASQSEAEAGETAT